MDTLSLMKDNNRLRLHYHLGKGLSTFMVKAHFVNLNISISKSLG